MHHAQSRNDISLEKIRMYRLPNKPWVTVIGNVEGLLAVICMICAFQLIRLMVELPLLPIVMCAIGAGFALGGIRYGTRLGRALGEVVTLVVSCVLAYLLILALPNWNSLWEYWLR